MQIVGVDRELLTAADRRSGDDFEDNLQVECAIGSDLDAIDSRDPKGFDGSPIPVLSPSELIARITHSAGS